MGARRNIILVGFMGAGKTAVSHLLAERLGWERIDTDDLIVECAGKSIPEIFAQDGEPHFRDLETEVIRGLGEREHTVISTGGGCVMRDGNMRALAEAGMVVHLAARPDVIMDRCEGDTNRPLLQVEDPMARIQELLDLRAPHYARAHHTVDTSDLTLEEVAEMIISLWQGETEG
ncbi:shikimate kinase [Candidatus Sumerlaeota bacterium]|nr:shikimate kinase [Candidatus Sumerlaeota bacterium]